MALTLTSVADGSIKRERWEEKTYRLLCLYVWCWFEECLRGWCAGCEMWELRSGMWDVSRCLYGKKEVGRREQEAGYFVAGNNVRCVRREWTSSRTSRWERKEETRWRRIIDMSSKDTHRQSFHEWGEHIHSHDIDWPRAIHSRRSTIWNEMEGPLCQAL